jgi:hypothetical protein
MGRPSSCSYLNAYWQPVNFASAAVVVNPAVTANGWFEESVVTCTSAVEQVAVATSTMYGTLVPATCAYVVPVAEKAPTYGSTAGTPS